MSTAYFPSLLVVVGAFVAAVSVLWDRGEKKKVSAKIAVLAAFISLCGGVWGIYVAAQSEKHLIGNLTGGDSFCWVSPPRGASSRESYDLFLFHKGSYPVYDVSVQIQDINQARAIFQDIERKGERSLEGVQKSIYAFPVVNMVPGSAVKLGQLTLPQGIEAFEYVIKIIARNGFYSQTLKCHRGSKNMVFATRVIRDFDKEIVHEFVHPEFPRNSAGEVDW